MIPTMIIKPLTAVWFTAKSPKLLCGRNLLALLLAGIVSNAGYYVAEALFSGNWLSPARHPVGGRRPVGRKRGRLPALRRSRSTG